MATFDECADKDTIKEFSSILENFNGVAVGWFISPADKNEFPHRKWEYVIALSREFNEQEKQSFPSEFRGISVKTHVLPRDWQSSRGRF